MPKCIRCDKVLPPQFLVELDVQVALDEQPKQCVFCKQDIKEITLTQPDGSTSKYTKEDAMREYVIFLNMLKEKVDNVKKLAEGKIKFEPNSMKG